MLALKAETLFGTSTAVVRESTPSVNSASSLLAYGRGLKWFAGAKREWHLRLFHLTFQEYMASVHIKEERLLTELISRVNQTWWHETARLYSAQSDASPIAYSSGFTCSIRPEQSENCTGWDRNSDYSQQSVIRNAGLAPVFLPEYKQGYR
jgi:hypothetical protein